MPDNEPARPNDDSCPETSTISLLKDLESRYSGHQLDAAWKNERDAWHTILEELRWGKGGIGFNYAFESVLGLGGAVYDRDDPFHSCPG